MNDSQSRQIDRSQRVHEFVIAEAAAFPAGSHAAELIAEHNTVIAQAEQFAGKQATAHLDWQEATEEKNAAIKSLAGLMKAMSETARSINKTFPGIADQFKMPRDSDQNVVNHANGYIEAATPIAVEFTKRGFPSSFLTDMQAAVQKVEAAESHQSQALENKIKATANLKAALKREDEIVRELRPIMRNTFRNDPGALAAWESASRVEKAPKKAGAAKQKPQPPATPPTP